MIFHVDNATDELGFYIGPVKLSTHKLDKCQGRHCVIHNPSNHHMIDWPLSWRDDKAQMERICQHGVGHPDPDDLSYQISIGNYWADVHGCDGCCAKD